MVLRRLHRRVEQVALLLLCKVAQLAQGRDRAGALDDDVGRQPVLVGEGVEVGAGGDGGLGLLLRRVGVLRQAGGQDQAEGEGGSEEHTSELQSLMRISYAVFCLKKKK